MSDKVRVINFKNGSVKHMGFAQLFGVSISSYTVGNQEIAEFLRTHIDTLYTPRILNIGGDTVDHAMRSLYFYTSDRKVLLQFKLIYAEFIVYIEEFDTEEERWEVLYDRYP